MAFRLAFPASPAVLLVPIRTYSFSPESLKFRPESFFWEASFRERGLLFMVRWLSPRKSSRLLIAAVVLMCLACQSGCVRRRMTVRSNPPGAKVYIDDQEIGTTPCSTYFTYYAGRKVTLVKDGYRTETVYQNIDAPWYQYPGIDFVAENLWPREIRDERVLEFQLVPDELVPPDRLIANGERLRQNARDGNFSPLIKGPQREALPPNVGLPGMGLPENAPLPAYSNEPLPPPGS